MATPDNSAEERALSSGWVDFGDGVNATRSAEIIQQALLTIQQQHIFCIVVAKGYESGKVVILEFGPRRLVLDRPAGWPDGMGPQPLRILFRDKLQIWNQFAVQLLEVTPNSLITTMPLKYIQLQRRANFRVEAPLGSRVLFQYRGEVRDNFFLENISANGGLFCLDDRRAAGLAVGELISQINMTFPCEDNEIARVQLQQGRVVRSCENRQRARCFGVQFLLQLSEEKELFRYVRRRERELLRKGMAEEL